MTERGILFSAPMVRALLDGSKTQTRRALRVQPLGVLPMNGDLTGREWVGLMTREPKPEGAVFRCKFGVPGDRLWVRETFVAFGRWETRYSEKKKRDEWFFNDMTIECGRQYRFDGADPGARRRAGASPTWHTRPSIFMPRAASRLLLEITSVRVERLQAISEADAYAEGVEPVMVPVCCGEPHREDHGVLGVETFCCGQPIEDEKAVPAYRSLWESINGPGSWDANPWVWVVEFKRVQP